MAQGEQHPIRPSTLGGPEKPRPSARLNRDLIGVFQARIYLCRTCPTPCVPLPRVTNLSLVCPLTPPRWPDVDLKQPGLGDWIERMAKPFAKALHAPCLDKDGKLRQESGCAKRRDMMNRAGKAITRTLTSFLKPNAE